MLLKDVLNIFDKDVSEYITKIEYDCSPEDFVVELEKYDSELEQLYTINISLFEDGTTLVTAKVSGSPYDDVTELNLELVSIASKIVNKWESYVNKKE